MAGGVGQREKLSGAVNRSLDRCWDYEYGQLQGAKLRTLKQMFASGS